MAFVQCAGSRDEDHLPYCSGVCCLASLKQATYVRDQYSESTAHIFYIDVRAQGKFEDFIDYNKVENYRNFGGIRIEDNVLVHDAGKRVLGKPIAKTIEEVEALSSQIL